MPLKDYHNRKTVFITGSTGVMGYATLQEFMRRGEEFNIRLLVRDSAKNRRKMRKYMNERNVTIIWGDLMNASDVRRAMGKADYVLHLGGMVSPMADHYPEKTLKVNIGAMDNIIKAVKSSNDADEVRVVYIGSVAQTSNYNPPYHWGRTGDPIIAAQFDWYGVSKIKAEMLLAESGLKHWVSLRQTGILHPGLIDRATDPISFHVPLNGVLEWVSVEDSARLMVNLCMAEDVPDSFWRGFYNIGGGKEFRLTNYQFEKLLMESIGCPPPEKTFERNWFATRNFHGEWFEDSDKLEELFHFREEISAEDYFKRLARQMPWWTRLAPIAPASLIKCMMKMVAYKKRLGPLSWLKRNDCEEKINAFFGSREEQSQIEGWESFDATPPSQQPLRLNHGYDDSKPDSEITIEDLRKAAEFRGGKLLSTEFTKGSMDNTVEWECSEGHQFKATPRTILRGGHWCEECLPGEWNYDKKALKSLFLKQKFKNINHSN